MKKVFLLVSLIILGFSAVAQTSPLKMVNFHKLPNEIADLKALKDEAGRDCDSDSNKAALIIVKTQGFSQKVLLDFNYYTRGIEMIHHKIENGELLWYLGSNSKGSIVIKYMGEYEFKIPHKLEAKAVYELVLGMETATLVIRAIPSEAEIYIDNDKVGTGEAISTVSIGVEHRYRIVCKDYYTKEGVVFFSQREEKSVNVELEPNFGYITIKSEPAGADVYVDDVKVGVTPYMMKKIKLGSRVVELRKTGFETYADMVTVKSNEVNKQLENVNLTAVRVPMGSLELVSNPTGAVITINGRQYGQTPKTLPDLEVGTYTVYFSKEGYQNLSQIVTVKDGKKETLNVILTKTTVQQPQVPTTPVNITNTTVSANGAFSVSSTKKVNFAKGNLQYQASTNTWRFAEHQWDMIGDANKNISSDYSGWIDLFGWGTGNDPTMIVVHGGFYSQFSDWGNNNISNGEGKNWFTLTLEEWKYVCDRRSTTSGIRYAKAIVHGVNGVILLPDNWSRSNYSLYEINKYNASFSSNRISLADWTNRLEPNGAVFLPAAGGRFKSDVNNVGTYGFYWSATHKDDGFNAYKLWFDERYVVPSGCSGRNSGDSVRLVSLAE